MSNIKVDCNACKGEQSMVATKVSKFGGIVKFIGYVITIPSILGIIFALLLFVSAGSASNEVMSTAQSDAEIAGAAIGAGIGFGAAIFIGISSLAGGLVGWILIMKKKVFKCTTCGFILDRA